MRGNIFQALRKCTTKTAPFHLWHIDPTQSDFERSLVSVLKSCTTNTGRRIHGLVVKSALDSNTFISNSLINLYAKSGCIRDAELLFGSHSRLDHVSCFDKEKKNQNEVYSSTIEIYILYIKKSDKRMIYYLIKSKYTSLNHIQGGQTEFKNAAWRPPKKYHHQESAMNLNLPNQLHQPSKAKLFVGPFISAVSCDRDRATITAALTKRPPLN